VSGFLELINNMLTSGMVPALYGDDEKESIVGAVRITTTRPALLACKICFSLLWS
jgi:dynein heavy chain